MSESLVFGITLKGDGSEMVDVVQGARKEVDALTKSTAALSAGSSKMASEYSGMSQAIKMHTTAVADTDAKVGKLLDRYDPLGAKLRQLQADFKALDQAVSGGKTAGRDDARVDAVYTKLNQQIAYAKTLLDQAGSSGEHGFGKISTGAGQARVMTAGATRELVVLAHEALTGNFSRIPGSLMVMGEKIGGIGPLFAAAFTPMGAVIAGVTAAVAAGGYAWYEWGQQAQRAADKAREGLDKVSKSADAAQRATRLENIHTLDSKIASKSVDAATQNDIATDTSKPNEIRSLAAKTAGEYRREVGGLVRQRDELLNQTADTWNGMYASSDDKRTAAIQKLEKSYLEQRGVYAGQTDKLKELADQRLNKLHAIELEYEKRTIGKPAHAARTRTDPNATAAAQIEADAFKAQMASMGVAAEQVKVYELARHGATTAQIEAAQASANIKIALDDEAVAIKAAARAADDLNKVGAQQVKAIQDQLAVQRAHNEEIGLSKPQLEALAATRLDLAAAANEELAANVRVAADYAGPLHDAYLQHAADLRAVATGQRAMADAKRSASGKEASVDEAKKAADEFQKSSDRISQSLTDALMRGFENGKSFSQNLRDTTYNLFKTMVLEPQIKASVKPLADALNKVIDGFAKGIADAMSQSGSGSGGGSIGGGIGSFLSGLFNANGNAFGNSGVQAFANGGAFTNNIVSSATPFKFANGGGFGLGVMGEAGPEAVMPLTRTAGGQLGVRMAGTQGSAQGNITVNVMVNTQSGTVDSKAQGGNANNGGLQQLGSQLGNMVRDILVQEKRPGGVLA